MNDISNKLKKRKQILDILANEYSYDLSKLKYKSDEELEVILKKRRQERKNGTSILKDFWVIKGMKRPDTLDNDGIEGTQKIAWFIFAAWISSFIIFGLFLFLMIYFTF